MPQHTKENPLFSLVFNVVLPSLILMKLSAPEQLGALHAFLIALAFPVCYSIYEFLRSKKVGFIPVLGFVSVLLTGGMGLMKLDGIWFAVKEALIPLIIGGAVVVSMKTRYPLLKKLLLNDAVMNVEKITRRLQEQGNANKFERLLVVTTWLLGASFLLSAVLNFTLAVVILKSPTGSVEFNQELGKMTALSFPVIVLPCMIVFAIALVYLFRGIKRLTGLTTEEFVATKKKS